jgi:hypothetical protein
MTTTLKVLTPVLKVAGILGTLGVVPFSPTSDGVNQVLEAAGDFIGVCDQKSSVDDYKLFTKHLSNESSEPSQDKVSGAPLRELETFFREKDPDRTFGGLKRIADNKTGAALWTLPENEKLLTQGMILTEEMEKAMEREFGGPLDRFEALKEVHESYKVQHETVQGKCDDLAMQVEKDRRIIKELEEKLKLLESGICANATIGSPSPTRMKSGSTIKMKGSTSLSIDVTGGK